MAGDPQKIYRFLTGEDTPEFCARVSAALDEGYVLYGDPVMVMDGKTRIVGQAVVWGQSQQGDVDVQKEDRR